MLNKIVQKSKQKIVRIATKKKFIRNIIEKRQISMKFPASLFIEPTNLCNLKCSMCPQSLSNSESQSFAGAASMRAHNEEGRGQSQPLQSDGVNNRSNAFQHFPHSLPEKGFMDFDLYKSIIDESAKFGKRTTIFFHKDGEPLLHPRLPEMIEYAVSRKAAFQTHLSTNAMLLQGKVLEDILKSGIDSIIVNLDAATAETYKKVKNVAGFEKVEENVKNFIAMKKSLHLIKPFIRIKFIPVKENLGEIELFKKKWNNLADEVVISREFAWPGLPDERRGAGSSNTNSELSSHFIGEDKSEVSPPLMGGDKGEGEDGKYHPHPNPLPSRKRENAGKIGVKFVPANRYPCISLWLALTINWDGTVSICCIDFYHRGILGNLKNNSIEQLWQGKKLEEIRTAHLEGKFNTVQVCSDCKGLWIRDTLGKGAEKWLRAKMNNSKPL